MKKLILSALAVCTILAGCSKDEKTNVEIMKDIRINLPGMNVPDSRNVEPPVAAGERTAIDNVIVYLMAGNSVFSVTGINTPPSLPIQIQNVPSSVNRVLVVANVPDANWNDYIGFSIEDEITAFPFTIESQSETGISSKFHIGEEVMSAALLQATNPIANSTNDYYLMEVTLASISSRFEIGAISEGTGIVAGSLTLHGIWINNYWDWDSTTPGVVNNVSDSEFWDTTEETSTAMAAPYTPVPQADTDYIPSVLFEEFNEDVDGEDLCYAFTLFTGSDSYVPQLILLVSGQYEEGYFTAPNSYFFGWITFNKFELSTSAGTYITSIEPNMIYKVLDGIQVLPSWITTEPNIPNTDLGITVTMEPWTETNVIPGV